MDTDLSPSTRVREQKFDHGDAGQDADDSSWRHERGSDIASVAHVFQFVTLAFDRPQTVFHLPQWRWPLIGSYNGFSGGARIRGWQLLRFYESNGWLAYSNVCSVTGTVGDTQLHNEDYAHPWDAFPVSKRAHWMIHTRHRFPRAWGKFLADEALTHAWAKRLSCVDTGSNADNDCSAAQMLALAPHPASIVVPVDGFDSR